MSNVPRESVLHHLRIAAATAREWSGNGTNLPSRHAMRLDRMRRAWPALANALDGLVESVPTSDAEAEFTKGFAAPRVACPACHVVATHVHATPDPRTGALAHRVQPCGHEVDADTAMALHEAGLNINAKAVDGAGLIRAEVSRNRQEKGRTREHDTTHTDGELAWAAWCILDRMNHPEADDVPAMWPQGFEWKPERTPMRALIVAGALISSEIDRRIEERERALAQETVTAGAVHDAVHADAR